MSGAPHADRLGAQMLSGPPARDPVTVVERLLAVQAQDQRGARLAIRARSTGLTSAQVDDALTADRSLVVTWLNRGTLHLVRSEDYPWLRALTAPSTVTANAHRLQQQGVSADQAERGVAVIERSLRSSGPMTRDQLAACLDSAQVPTAGQALVHLLLLTSLRGLTVRGPMVGDRHAYVLVRDWLDRPGTVDRPVALAELARRYLAGHGPADERDLAKWSGLPLRDARAGLRSIGSELHQRSDGLADLIDRPPRAGLPTPRLLGSFDPLLHGWSARGDVLGSHRGVVTTNGIFRPIALAGGRAIGTWRLAEGGVVLTPFGAVTRPVAKALAVDAADVARFLGISDRPLVLEDADPRG